VPEDISIVGFDDTAEAELVTPQLTTVRQPLAEMGRMGVSLLMRLLEGRRFEALHVELATALVVRGSTAPPPSGR
jgi:LacI family transcriptional regulator